MCGFIHAGLFIRGGVAIIVISANKITGTGGFVCMSRRLFNERWYFIMDGFHGLIF